MFKFKIDRKALQYPSCCYTSAINRMFGIVSPSKLSLLRMGFYGEKAEEQAVIADVEHLKVQLNNRTLTKSGWFLLYRFFRIEEGKGVKTGWTES